MNARRIEVIAALACILLTLFGLLAALVTPSSSESSEAIAVSSDNGTSPPPEIIVIEGTSSWTDDVEPITVAYVIVIVGTGVLVGILGIAHGRLLRTNISPVIWVGAALMAGLALIGALSIGLFFLPAVIAAFVTAGASGAYAAQRRSSPDSTFVPRS